MEGILESLSWWPSCLALIQIGRTPFSVKQFMRWTRKTWVLSLSIQPFRFRPLFIFGHLGSAAFLKPDLFLRVEIRIKWQKMYSFRMGQVTHPGLFPTRKMVWWNQEPLLHAVVPSQIGLYKLLNLCSLQLLRSCDDGESDLSSSDVTNV